MLHPYCRSYSRDHSIQVRFPKTGKQPISLQFSKRVIDRPPSNYRPVSLTCVSCKILEHIVFHSVMEHVDWHKILSVFQHGFRALHSCETQLITTVQDLAKGLSEKEQLDLLILDFSKAFDVVPHKRLINKLNYYGIRNSTLTWIDNWLTGRTQRVVVDGESSSKSPVKSGVPQGTVLDPVMFILYINDIVNKVGFRYQGWVSSGRNLFLPGRTEESGRKYFFRVSSVQKWNKVEETGI